MSEQAKPFDLNEYLDKVGALTTKHTVEAHFAYNPGFKEAGLPGHLVFKCPVCGHQRGIDREGKFLCTCGTPLEIKRIA